MLTETFLLFLMGAGVGCWLDCISGSQSVDEASAARWELLVLELGVWTIVLLKSWTEQLCVFVILLQKKSAERLLPMCRSHSHRLKQLWIANIWTKITSVLSMRRSPPPIITKQCSTLRVYTALTLCLAFWGSGGDLKYARGCVWLLLKFETVSYILTFWVPMDILAPTLRGYRGMPACLFPPLR